MAQFKGKTALIVDDFPTARRFIRNTMEELEFTCIEAGSATQALDLLEYEIPDVILTDLLHQRLGQRVEGSLGSAVGGAAGEWMLAGKTAHIDDPSVAS